MRSKDIRGRSQSVNTIIMSGGLNQSLSNIELEPGELYEVSNYEEIDGQNFGYRSTDGYERMDGQHLASSVTLAIDYDTVPATVDDTAREAERALVTEVPGSGDILGVLKLNGEIYAFRSNTTLVKMYKATVTGWSEIASYTALAVPDQSTQIHISYSRFQFFDTNNEVAVICTGNTLPILFAQDETCTIVDPEDAGTTKIFPSGEYPYRSYEFGGRLFLAFDKGNLYFSGIGRPEEFDPATYLGGAYYLTDLITDMIVATQALIVFCEDSIHVIRRLSGIDEATSLDIRKDVLNGEEGALAGTAQEMLGMIVYASREGITTLNTTEAYGDFDQVAISRKIKRTFDEKKNLITTSSVVRDKSQYRLYFSDNTAIAVTFNIERQPKGSTILRYFHPVLNIYEDTDNIAYFTSTEGFLYRRSERARSFDGDPIFTLIRTTFYHYKSPVEWKTFFRVMTELSTDGGVRLFFRPIYDYKLSQAATQDIIDTLQRAGNYNDSYNWGTPDDDTIDAVWGVEGGIQRTYSYIRGIGTNMSLNYYSVLKHYAPHTIHNAVVTFSRGGIDY